MIASRSAVKANMPLWGRLIASNIWSTAQYTPAESVIEPGDNQRSDDEIGFGLLNCEDAEEAGCDYDDLTTTCRVVFLD